MATKMTKADLEIVIENRDKFIKSLNDKIAATANDADGYIEQINKLLKDNRELSDTNAELTKLMATKDQNIKELSLELNKCKDETAYIEKHFDEVITKHKSRGLIARIMNV